MTDLIGLDTRPFGAPAAPALSAGHADPVIAPRAKSGEGTISLAVYGDLTEAEPAWRVFEATAYRTFFQSFDWLAAWQRHVGARTRTVPAIVTGTDADGTLLFMLPLAIERHGVVRHLTFLGSDLCDYNAPLLHPEIARRIDDAGFAALWPRIAAKLRSDRRFAFDVIDLAKMPEMIGSAHNPLMALRRSANPSGAYLTKLTGPWDDFYAAKRSASTRKKERQQARQLAAFGDVLFVDTLEGTERAKTIDILFEQKARSFERMGVRDIFVRPGYRELFTSFAMNPRTRHLVHLSRLEVGETIAAISIGFTASDCYYLVVSSYQLGDMARVGPGRVHLHELLQHAIGNGLGAFDFTIGDEAYKRDWADARITLHDHLSAATLRGALAVTLIDGFRTAKRAIKQNPVFWRLFSRARSKLGAMRSARTAEAGNGDTNNSREA
jgi:CelD/BcsL family acetyltransferase involved in cellulose biosynthesis